MKYVSEFRNRILCDAVLSGIRRKVRRKAVFMEVCGTHTVSIFRSGIRRLLPEELSLLSGPGCPVCVTSQADLDRAIAFSRLNGTITATYGDMLRVPGSTSSLEKERAAGSDIRVVYSTLDALRLAENNRSRQVIFFGAGFETTTPASAVAVLEAERKKLDNFSLLSCHKLIPPAMKALLESGETAIDGFLCPGHVSTITGSADYEFIAADFNIPCVIAGFEPLDILESVSMLLGQVESGRASVEIQYKRSVKPEGNPKAKEILYHVFDASDANWRGMGMIPGSGLKIRKEFAAFDAASRFDAGEIESVEPPGCICGEILRGIKLPFDCPLFGKACTPDDPTGPCMVSSEGTCGAWFKYGMRERI